VPFRRCSSATARWHDLTQALAAARACARIASSWRSEAVLLQDDEAIVTMRTSCAPRRAHFDDDFGTVIHR